MAREALITLTLKNGESKTIIVGEGLNDCIVGRKQDCGIYVNDALVSSRHGQFFWSEGQLFYADLNSTNGSFVDGIQVRGTALVQNGSVITLAGIESMIKLTVVFQQDEVGEPNNEANNRMDLTSTPKVHGAAPETRNPNNSLNNKATLLVGRDPSCDILLPNQNVSRFHAKLLRRDGRCYLEDNNSTNGTFVNGIRIGRVCEITPKDDIYIASVRMKLINGILSLADDVISGLSVQIHDLHRVVTEKGAPKTLLDHITLSIESNEFVAVIGGSGAGKSTFMNVLCGKNPVYGGNVTFNKSMGTDNRSMFKSVVGYAPQNDILYHDLTLQQMLFYSAKLKMPQDTKPNEYEERVKYVINKVELTGHENTLVRRLSGGQQKRASIAVELLSDPKLFFLDEPTSGLDPATERKLMRMLKEMTKDNKTIVAVTHVTQNLSLCDKVIVLGRGGKLCFFGTPTETCKYFEVTDIVDIYDKINENPEMWQKKYQELIYAERVKAGSGSGMEMENNFGLQGQNAVVKSKKDVKSGYNSGWSQFLVLAARYMRLTFGDPKRCLLLLLQAPILGVLLMLVSTSSATDGKVFDTSTDAKSMLFSLTCAAFWVGMLNSIQEICKEKDIFNRERMSTVRLFPYIFSKIMVIGLLCVFQAFILTFIVQLFVEFPATVLGKAPNTLAIPPFLSYFLTVFLTTLCAACLGLTISSLSPNPDRAMAIAPLILLPQILFSSVVFELKGYVYEISNIIPCKLSMQNFGTLSNINVLKTSADVAEKSMHFMYNAERLSNVLGTWQWLLLFSLIYICVFALALKLKSKE